MRPIVHIIGVLAMASAVTSCGAPDVYNSPDAPLTEVPFTAVHFDDGFWAPRIETNRTVSIPSAFHECEVNGRFDNFAIAGGLMKGEHRGDFSFDDTDPYKIIEGASYSLAAKYDRQLDAYLDSVITLIAAAQEPDGYLTTCVTNRCERLSGWWGTRRWEKINSHELYNSGHLYEAAVAHYQATGKRTLLDVALKNADLVCDVFGMGENQIHYPSGHPIIEMALVKLYKVTGERKYLDEARYFVDEAGRLSNGRRPSPYSQDHMPVMEQEEIVGHAVRAGYFYSGVADVAGLQNDTELFNALERIWNNMASRKLYVTGGIGSRAQGEGFGPEYELHNHTAYCETCASIANVYWNYRMFLATGEARYADVCERALYNGVISGVSLSGDRFFYDNPLESMGQHERAPWFGCACCPGNVTRFMASIPQYVYAVQGDDVYVNMYVNSTADIKTDGNNVTLVQETRYPWDGKVTFTITPGDEKEWALRLRIPGWTTGKPVSTDLYSYTGKTPDSYTVTVNGSKARVMTGNGYATVKRSWKAGDRVELTLPMEVRRIAAHDSVVDDRGKLAIERGPVIYCLEGPDQADSTVFNKVLSRDVEFDESYEPDFLGGVVTLTAKAGEVQPDGTLKDVTVKAIPYSTWNNRGPAQMAVWIPETAGKARAVPASTIASEAEMYSEPTALNADAPAATSNLQWAWGYNDQWEPASSADTSKPYHYWWLRHGTEENLCYRFKEPVEVSSVDVYWLDFDHYDGNYRTPQRWNLYYKDPSGRWAAVTAKGEFGTARDQYNHVDFDPVTTTALKLVAKLQDGESGGVIEWKVN